MDLLPFHRQLPENNEGIVWKKTKDNDRFMVARPGESLVSPFQCDFCWFINLTGRVFDARRVGDRINLAIIRRVNLDVFWSREASTVINSNRLFY